MSMRFYCPPCKDEADRQYAEYQKDHPGEGTGHRLVWLATMAVAEDTCPNCGGLGFSQGISFH